MPARITPVPPGWTESAPMLMEASVAPDIAARLSVSGTNLIFAVLDVAAFCDTHTPPPVVPTKSRLPVGSDGSSASADMRPVTKP